jgi:outer membrane autotransporter protein
MLKKVLSFPMCLLLLGFFCFEAYADNGWYIKGSGGASLLDDATFSEAGQSRDVSFDTGLALAGTAGYDFSGFRIEAELGFRENDVNTVDGISAQGNLTTSSLLFNAFYDFRNSSRWTPYLGAGIGGADIFANDIKVGSKTLDDDQIVFAYQLKAGVGYGLGRNMALSLDYSYFTTADPQFNGVDEEYRNHTLALGLNFALN